MSTRTDMIQDITPALRDWIAAQQAAGFEAPQILQAMTDAGWAEAVARQSLGLPGLPASEGQPVLSAGAGLPAALPLPWPARAGACLKLDAGDRQVKTVVVLQDPPLLVLDGLLTDAECEALIAAAASRMSRSLTVDVKTGGEETNQDRTSEGMFFSRGETELVARLEQRIAHLLGWPVENGEGLQVLRYGPGAQYKPHYDYFDPQEPGTPSILQRGGQRVATLIIYLNEPVAGGATSFPDAALSVVPQRGHAVFFNYSQPHPLSRTLHGGEPVIEGEKWIATKWLRERQFS